MLQLPEFFDDVYNQIFREVSENEVFPQEEVAVLKIKEQVKVINLDDTEPEVLDFEDKKINIVLDQAAENVEKINDAVDNQPEEIVRTPKKRGRKPKALTQPVSEQVVAIEPKRRGRKPKLKQVENVENSPMKIQQPSSVQTNIDLEKITDIEDLRQKLLKKAEEDAEKLSQLYIDTLLAKLKENVQNAFNSVLEKFSDIFKM